MAMELLGDDNAHGVALASRVGTGGGDDVVMFEEDGGSRRDVWCIAAKVVYQYTFTKI